MTEEEYRRQMVALRKREVEAQEKRNESNSDGWFGTEKGGFADTALKVGTGIGIAELLFDDD